MNASARAQQESGNAAAQTLQHIIQALIRAALFPQLAAKLMKRYQNEFLKQAEGGGPLTEQDLKVLLSWYAEDVMRTVEKEVREIEAEIREQYPMAAYIELEPDSKDSGVFAIDQGKEGRLRRDEIAKLNKMLLSIIEEEKAEEANTTKFDKSGKFPSTI